MLGLVTLFKNEGLADRVGLSGIESNIQSTVKPELQAYAKLPGRISATTVTDEAQKAASLEATSKLIAEVVKHRAKGMQALVATYQSQAQHQRNVLSAQRRMTQIDSRYGQFLLGAQLGINTARVELDGYQQAYQSAQSAFVD